MATPLPADLCGFLQRYADGKPEQPWAHHLHVEPLERHWLMSRRAANGDLVFQLTEYGKLTLERRWC